MEKTVVKAFALLEALANSEAPRGVSELGRELSLNKSNVHRLLETLQEIGYVQREDAGAYSLTLKVWKLGVAVVSRLDVKDVALPHLRGLMEQTGETARLTIFVDGQGVCIEQVQSPNPIGIMTRVGGTLLGYCSATGKALLAHQPEAVIERIAKNLIKFTPRTVGTEEELHKELEKIRRQGFAINYGEWRQEVSGVGAPVRGSDGAVVAALGVSGPSERLRPKVLQSLAPLIRDTAQQMSRELGFCLASSEEQRRSA